MAGRAHGGVAEDHLAIGRQHERDTVGHVHHLDLGVVLWRSCLGVGSHCELVAAASMLNFFSVSMSSLDMPMTVAPGLRTAGVASANW